MYTYVSIMQATTIEQRFRTFLLGLAGWICAGTIAELWGLGLIAGLAALLCPRRGTLLALRLLIAGAALGCYQRIENNLELVREIRPSAALSQIWLQVLRGASPLLAPGILALAATLAIAATYYHPALWASQGAGD